MEGSIFEDTVIRLIKDNTNNTDKKNVNFTFFSHLTMNCRKVFTDKVNVLSSKVDGNITLMINEAGLEKLSIQERKERVVKELVHIISLHHSRSTSAEDFSVFSMASDLAISHYTPNLPDLPRVSDFNEESNGPLPDNVVSMSRFKQQKQQINKLEENEVTEYYYEYLKELQQKQPQNFSQSMESSGEGQGQEGEPGEGEGKGQPKEQKQQMQMKVGNKTFKEDTDKQQWKNSSVNEDYAKEVVKDLIKRAKEGMSKAGGAGTVGGDLEMLIEDLYKSEVNWKQQLNKILTRKFQAGKKNTRKKRNRRTEFLTPGKKRLNELHVAFIRDTSGSCASQEIQGQFLAEMDKVHRSGAKITVIDADTDVTSVFEYCPKKVRTITGMGGTCYGPALKAAEDLDADCCVYLGDMDASDTPSKPKKMPVIWCTTGQKPPVDWGYVVEVKVK